MQSNGTIPLSPWEMKRISDAIVYVEKNYRAPISADQLSIEVSLSKEKLQAGLQRKTGHTLHMVVLCVRMEKAKELLRDTNKPVKSIALATGFKRSSHFIDIFKRFHDQTPKQYRVLAV